MLFSMKGTVFSGFTDEQVISILFEKPYHVKGASEVYSIVYMEILISYCLNLHDINSITV